MRRPRFRFRLRLRLREAMLLVACCAVGCWDLLALRYSDPIADAARRLRARAAQARREAAAELGERMTDAVPALPALAAATRDRDAGVRRAAAEAIGIIARRGPASGSEEDAAVRVLTVGLRDPDPQGRELAATALGWMAAPAAAPALAEALRDPDPSVRRAAAGALFAIGPPARGQLPALLAAIAAEADPRRREDLVANLPRLDPDPAAAVPPLISRLARDPDAGVRAAAARALGEVIQARVKAGAIPPEATPAVAALDRALSDPAPRVRAGAASALGGTRDTAGLVLDGLIFGVNSPSPRARARAAAVPPSIQGPFTTMRADLDARLLRALSHRHADVRAAAAARLAGRQASGPLIRALGAALGDPDADVRREAAVALGGMAARPLPDATSRDAFVAILPALRSGLRDRHPDVPFYAFLTITSLGRGAPDDAREFRDAARDAARAFVARLRDPSEDVRLDTVSSLGGVDPREAGPVIEALRGVAAHDGSSRVRTQAAAVLRGIETSTGRQ